MQVGEGQRGGDERLDEYGVHTDGQGTHGATPSGFRHGWGRDVARDGRADRGSGCGYSATGRGVATGGPDASTGAGGT